jgi:N-acetylglutamate synthase-like GNAT family acetyltransferase
MADAKVRTAIMGDAEQVSQLITELGYPTTLEAMRERLSRILTDPNYATFVADRDGDVVGVAGATLSWYYEKDGMYSRLAVLAVSSTARGLGIGGQLVQAIEAWTTAKGVREVFVNSGLHRGDAHRFYERCGYSRTGFRFVKQLNAR